MDKFSYLGTSDVNAIENLYQQYVKDENSVDVTWRDFFRGFEFAKANYDEPAAGGAVPENIAKEFKVITLINGYTDNVDICLPKQILFANAVLTSQPWT
jgi:2-oxoglutarate dehydrogenase E1 component